MTACAGSSTRRAARRSPPAGTRRGRASSARRGTLSHCLGGLVVEPLQQRGGLVVEPRKAHFRALTPRVGPLGRGLENTTPSLFSPSKLKVQQTLRSQQNRALHRSTTHPPRHAPDVELYSSTALQSALHLYSSTALYTLHPLHPPSDSGEAPDSAGCAE